MSVIHLAANDALDGIGNDLSGKEYHYMVVTDENNTDTSTEKHLHNLNRRPELLDPVLS